MSEIKLVAIVAGCVLQNEDTFLLVQERDEAVYGLWNLPAGYVELGETIEAAAVRETQEESGYQVALERKISIDHVSPDRPIFHAFKATITGGQLAFDATELLDARWFTLEEIQQMHRSNQLRNDWPLRSIEKSLVAS
ncbi:MAG TPA: NUDIX hydrolase [Candidatus Saccharimonadales bacterium]|nr:NUDIX hydrolase [Candidatus Saccharimonadales bacterium]